MSTISRRELCTGLGGAAGLASVGVPAAVAATETATPRSGLEDSPGRKRKRRELVGWEPIETAPRDGTLVLLLLPPDPYPHDEVVLARWSDESGTPPGPNGPFGWDIAGPLGGMWMAEREPTHWLPLPQYPDDVCLL